MNAENTTTESPAASLRPRIETRGPMVIAGLSGHHTGETLDDIPAQWARFVPHLGNIPGQVGEAD